MSAPLTPLSAPLSASLHASRRSVAFLWGAPKATNSPMSVDLVVDHIIEGDKTNYAVSNLQLMTTAENTRKSVHHCRDASSASTSPARSKSGGGISRPAGRGTLPRSQKGRSTGATAPSARYRSTRAKVFTAIFAGPLNVVASATASAYAMPSSRHPNSCKLTW